MKPLAFILFVIAIFLFSGCDQELKEHPVPPALKRQLEKQGDPKLQAQAISGTITVDKKIIKAIPESASLFIFVRAKGVRGGPPLAVKRFRKFKFPMDYKISPADSMMDGVQFSGEVTLTVRVDKDGIAGGGPGDIEGSQNAKAGDKNIAIVLNKVVGG